ncbi:MAG: copper resistance CopC family protein [Gemmatimonadaceae bacterium]
MLVLLVPAIVSAHGKLSSSNPASGARLDVVPRELRLTFSEMPEIAVTRVDLLGSDSVAVSLAPLQLADDRRTVVAAIRGRLIAGTQTVVWLLAGADGHPVRGRFRFVLAPGAEGLQPTGATSRRDSLHSAPRGEPSGAMVAPGQATAPQGHHDAAAMPQGDGFGAESAAYVVIRWLQFASLLLVLGSITFRWVVLRLVERFAIPGDGVMELLRDGAAFRAASVGMWAASVLLIMTALRLFAQSYAMHGSSDATNSIFVLSMLTGTVWGWGWLLQAGSVIVAMVGFALARRSKWNDTREVAIDDNVHGARRPEHAGWVIATMGGLALAVTPALRVKPSLGDIEGATRVKRTVIAELAIGLVVLLVTAALVATPPPADAASMSDYGRLPAFFSSSAISLR